MWFVNCLIYWLIGFVIIYLIADKSESTENSAWVIAYAFGIFLWPIVICGYLYNKINKIYYGRTNYCR
jgi:hypothetical protein